jgi:NADPH-dependent curcumin reductase CurA
LHKRTQLLRTPTHARHQVVTKRIKMQGFIVSDYMAELGAEFASNMAQYVLQGKVVVKEKVTQGIEHAGAAFVDMVRVVVREAEQGVAARRCMA